MDSESGPPPGIGNWREQIDALDEQLLVTLASRARAVEEIGRLKKARGIAPLDEARWRKVLGSKLDRARALGLSEEFVEKLYDLIHEYSLALERQA
jgi:chorismate mutase